MTVNDDYEEFYKSFLYRIQRQKERQQRTLTKEEASLDIPYVFEPCEKYFGDNPLWLVAKRAWKVFILGFKIYGPIHTLPVLIFKRKQLMQNPLETLSKLFKNSAWSSAFIAIYQTIFILGLASSNKLFNIDHPFGASVLPGVALLCEQSNRRTELMLYCVPRVHEVVTAIGQRERWWRDLDHVSAVLFCLTTGILLYFYSKEPRSIKPSIFVLMRQIVGIN